VPPEFIFTNEVGYIGCRIQGGMDLPGMDSILKALLPLVEKWQCHHVLFDCKGMWHEYQKADIQEVPRIFDRLEVPYTLRIAVYEPEVTNEWTDEVLFFSTVLMTSHMRQVRFFRTKRDALVWLVG